MWLFIHLKDEWGTTFTPWECTAGCTSSKSSFFLYLFWNGTHIQFRRVHTSPSPPLDTNKTMHLASEENHCLRLLWEDIFYFTHCTVVCEEFGSRQDKTPRQNSKTKAAWSQQNQAWGLYMSCQPAVLTSIVCQLPFVCVCVHACVCVCVCVCVIHRDTNRAFKISEIFKE